MTDSEKKLSGYLHDVGSTELIEKTLACQDLCFEYNMTRPSDIERRKQLLTKIFGRELRNALVVPPFHCDYGNITFGTNCVINYDCIFLDDAPITIGNYVFIAPMCCLSTVNHPLDVGQRNNYLASSLPIVIEDNVWLGARVTVAPGVTIGQGSVIGAGSVVLRDVPPGVLAAGVPCRVMRPITEQDKRHFPIAPEDEDNPRFCLGASVAGQNGAVLGIPGADDGGAK